MSQSLTRAVTFAVALQFLFVAAAGAQKAADKEIRARRAAFVKLVNDGKPQEAAKFAGESLTIVTGGETVKGEQAKEAFLRLLTLPEGVTITSRIDKVELKGDSAVLTVSDTANLTGPDGKKRKQIGHSRETWTKTDGQWLLTKNEEL